MLGAVLLLTAAACGSDDSQDTSSEGTTTTGNPTDDRYGSTDGDTAGTGESGAIVAVDFSLSDLTVAPGEEIVLQNDGSASHTATADEGAFDLAADGGTTSEPAAAPDEPGTYPFHCEIHTDMTATLTVEE